MLNKIGLFYSRLVIFVVAIFVLFSFLVKGIMIHGYNKIKEVRGGN